MGVPEGRVRPPWPPAPVPLRNGVPEGRVRPPAPVPLRNPDSGGLEGVEVPLSRWVHEGGSGQRLYRLLSTDSIPLRSWRQNSLRGRREWPLPMAITAQNTSQTALKLSKQEARPIRVNPHAMLRSRWMSVFASHSLLVFGASHTDLRSRGVVLAGFLCFSAFV